MAKQAEREDKRLAWHYRGCGRQTVTEGQVLYKYWGADEGMWSRCAGGCGDQLTWKGGNTLRTTAGEGGNCMF